MTETYSMCPKCGHRPAVPLANSEPCPACGIYVFKWNKPRVVSRELISECVGEVPHEVQRGLIASLLQPMEKQDAWSLYGRAMTLALLSLWSWFLSGYDYRDGEINGSFMHNILLPIHEAGHVLFIPFGEFMTILGGSLFQIVLPLAIGITFIAKQQDNFGGAICAWWASVSLVDLSPYIYDALRPQLTLVGGGTGNDRLHDWVYLLSEVGQLGNAQLLGGLVHACASVLMLASLAWAGVVLWRSRELVKGRGLSQNVAS